MAKEKDEQESIDGLRQQISKLYKTLDKAYEQRYAVKIGKAYHPPQTSVWIFIAAIKGDEFECVEILGDDIFQSSRKCEEHLFNDSYLVGKESFEHRFNEAIRNLKGIIS